MRSRLGSEGDPGNGRLPTEAAPVSRLARDSPTPGDPRQLSSQASRSSCWPWSRRAARTRRTVVVGLTSLAAESLGLADEIGTVAEGLRRRPRGGGRRSLEVYRTVIGTLQGIAWMLLLVFVVALVACVLARGFERRT